jgi:hypothetical protein
MPEAAVKAACKHPACRQPATIYAVGETGEPVPYCLEHGEAAGARLRCERCGLFKVGVTRVLMLGHRAAPAKRKAGAATGRLLCRDCVVATEAEQPDLFDGVGR